MNTQCNCKDSKSKIINGFLHSGNMGFLNIAIEEMKETYNNSKTILEADDIANTTIYISGAISNDNEYRSKFEKVEHILKSSLYKNVINPVNINHFGNVQWHDYMKSDLLALLKDADAICMLPDWQQSTGATLELFLATILKIKIYKYISVRVIYETVENSEINVYHSVGVNKKVMV